MSKVQSSTSTELLAVLKRWQETRQPEDAEFLADQLPHVLQDVARVKAGFLTLKERVRKLDDEMETYRQTRLLAQLDAGQGPGH